MRRLIDFYKLQIQVMRTWRPSTGSRLRRILATMIVSVVSFGVAVFLTPGVDLTAGAGIFSTALLAAIVLGILNVAIRPVLIAAFAAVSVIAVTVATLVFQVVSFLILPRFVDTLVVSGWLSALVASLIYAMTTTVFVAIFSISSDDSYFAILVQQLSARGQDVHRTDAPGLVVVQIDGLARQILTRQIQAGRAPHLSGWVRSGRYTLSGWEALLPPTTPASQAGLLHGNNDGIPAFRWYEKDAGRLMVTNHPDDAVVVESRISNGEGLLSNDGASVGNLFSGDAARSYITMATIKDKSQGLGTSTSFYSFFASPTNYLGTLTRFCAEIVKEYYQASRQVRGDIIPRMHRGMPYPFARATTNVGLRDLSTALVVEEMYRGAPMIYVDYTDYDEIAHHSGPERGGIARRAGWGRWRHRDPREGRRRHATSVPIHRAVRPRPDTGGDVPRALWQDPRRRRPGPDGQRSDCPGGHLERRGVRPDERVPVGADPGQGRHRGHRPDRPSVTDDGRRG